jgi:hypothetical protein
VISDSNRIRGSIRGLSREEIVMQRPIRTSLFVLALVLLSVTVLRAQTGTAPFGHWEGAIQAPSMEVKIEIDLAKNDRGTLEGTFGNPAEQVKGLPLASVAVQGATVTFELKAGSGGGTFTGVVAADGATMTGEFATKEGTVPFALRRTGDAHIEPRPKSAPISKDLEGEWNGVLDVQGKPFHVTLRLANEPDGTATATIASTGEGVEIPAAIVQTGDRIALEVKITGGSYAGTLNAARTEMTGTYTLRGHPLPLSFRRAGR